jgi:hypothetical protein
MVIQLVLGERKKILVLFLMRRFPDITASFFVGRAVGFIGTIRVQMEVGLRNPSFALGNTSLFVILT